MLIYQVVIGCNGMSHVELQDIDSLNSVDCFDSWESVIFQWANIQSGNHRKLQ